MNRVLPLLLFLLATLASPIRAQPGPPATDDLPAVGAIPVIILLTERAFKEAAPDTLFLMASMVPAALVCLLLVYPFNVWLARRGACHWPWQSFTVDSVQRESSKNRRSPAFW